MLTLEFFLNNLYLKLRSATFLLFNLNFFFPICLLSSHGTMNLSTLYAITKSPKKYPNKTNLKSSSRVTDYIKITSILSLIIQLSKNKQKIETKAIKT